MTPEVVFQPPHVGAHTCACTFFERHVYTCMHRFFLPSSTTGSLLNTSFGCLGACTATSISLLLSFSWLSIHTIKLLSSRHGLQLQPYLRSSFDSIVYQKPRLFATDLSLLYCFLTSSVIAKTVLSCLTWAWIWTQVLWRSSRVSNCWAISPTLQLHFK